MDKTISQLSLTRSQDQNKDVLIFTSLIHNNEMITHDMFNEYNVMLDEIAHVIRENNKLTTHKIRFFINSLKEARDDRSSHSTKNEKIGIDGQLVLFDENISKNSKNFEIHLAINLLWYMKFKKELKSVQEILIGNGSNTYMIHFGDFDGYNNPSFYELNIKNQVRAGGFEENKSSLQLLEMIPKSSQYTKLIPRSFLNAQLDLRSTELVALDLNNIDSLFIDPLKEGAEKTLNQTSFFSKIVGSIVAGLIVAYIAKEFLK